MTSLATLRRLAAAAALAAAGALPALAQDKPAALNIGVFTFLSGPAAAYGMPGKQAADLLIEQINAAGGIGGVPVSATFVDEAQGAEGVIAEYRRLAEDPANAVMIAALSSGNCLALAPIADQLKMPTIAWNCDTHQLYLKDPSTYFYRPNGNTIAEFIAFAAYFLTRNPDVKRIAFINPDYSFGHDAAQIVKAALTAFKPDVEVVAELFPKLGSATYQTEISRLTAARPDVIFSNLWGGDLENFIRQAQPRGLFQQSQIVLALGETVLQRADLPEGTIVGVLGDGWWMSPTAKEIGMAAGFADAYKARYGEYPVFPSIKMANALLVMKAAYEKAIAAKNGGWPTRDELVAALEGMSTQTMSGEMSFRADNDGVVDQVVGVTVKAEGYDFPVLGEMVRYDGASLLPPEGQDPIAWIGTLTPEFLAGLPKPGSYK
jgi:branched-chain amino acid transport system substrate-binding protein